MTAAEAERAIRRFEHTHDPLQYKLGRWAIWCILRMDAAVAVERPQLVQQRRLLTRPQLLMQAAMDAVALLRIKRAPILAYTFTTALVEKHGSKYKDAWYDDMLSELGVRSVRVEDVNSASLYPRRRRASHPADMSLVGLNLAASVMSRRGVSEEVRKVAHDIEVALQRQFGRDLFADGWALARIRYFEAQRVLYSRLVQRVFPRVVIVADPGQYALVAAAKEHGAWTVELQHGYVDAHSHPSYAWPAESRSELRSMPIPDRLFLYGAAWKENLDRNDFWRGALRVVGSTRVDSYRASRAARHADGTVRIVVTTQGVATEDVIRYIRELLSLAPSNISVVVKLHPVYESEGNGYRVALAADRRVHIISGGEDPSTFELLSRADAHLSIYSSCHMEAIALGVPTYVLPFAGHDAMEQLVASGAARVAPSAAALADMVATREFRVPSDADTEGARYFASGAVERSVAELRSLLSQPPREP